jgi:hypothetical protein
MQLKQLACVAMLMATLHLTAQDIKPVTPKTLDLSVGTFNTVNRNNKVTINPAISGNMGDYYFENRYNYEAENTASLNFGKRVFKHWKHIEIVPMTGFVFGNFKGITAELQVSADYPLWTLSTDNQYSIEYKQSGKRLFFNWSTARFKLNRLLRIGISTFLDNEPYQSIAFDKGLTAAIAVNSFAIRLYAFNIETDNRYYWIALRYNFKVRVLN